MEDDKWHNREINDVEMALLYKDFPNQWLLFEVLEINENRRPVLFKLIDRGNNKEDILDLIMENENWDSTKKHIILFADPDKPCDLE